MNYDHECRLKAIFFFLQKSWCMGHLPTERHIRKLISREFMIFVVLLEQKIVDCQQKSSVFESIFFRSRRIKLRLRWSCWHPPPLEGGWGGQFFEYFLKYLSYDHMANRKFFWAFWKKFDLKKEEFIKNFQPNFCFIFEITVYFTFPSI